MLSTIVLSALAATTMASPFVNIEMIEPTEIDMGRDCSSQEGFWSSLLHRGDHCGRRHGREHRREQMMDEQYNFVCIAEGRHGREERKADKQCCRKVGGRLSRHRGEELCVIENAMENPFYEWNECAMREHGIRFAECYLREQREIDHEMGRRHEDDEDEEECSGRRCNDRNRHDRDRHDRNRHRSQSVMDAADNEEGSGRPHFNCHLQTDNDEQRRDIMEYCCKHLSHGRIEDNQNQCSMTTPHDMIKFEECAMGLGGHELQCELGGRDQ